MPRMFWLALEWAAERRTAKRQENAKNGEHFGGGEAQAGARPQPDSVNPHTATSVCEKKAAFAVRYAPEWMISNCGRK
jgi:hypothetical protein